MKAILVLLDGLGDRTYARLEHKTPLAAARTPNLDRIAAMGANGTYRALSPGRCLPNEMAHFLMFGYNLADFPGRGLLEAAGGKNRRGRQPLPCLVRGPVNRPGPRPRRPETGFDPNFLVTQRSGKKKPLAAFAEKWGFSPAMIAAGSVYKVPDQVSHRETPERKAEVISALDSGFSGLLNLLESKEKDILAVVTADHSTPSCSELIHSGETVPLAMAFAWVRTSAPTGLRTTRYLP
jgi:hypothetical protein